jgi:hypothetical protein
MWVETRDWPQRGSMEFAVAWLFDRADPACAAAATAGQMLLGLAKRYAAWERHIGPIYERFRDLSASIESPAGKHVSGWPSSIFHNLFPEHRA